MLYECLLITAIGLDKMLNLKLGETQDKTKIRSFHELGSRPVVPCQIFC